MGERKFPQVTGDSASLAVFLLAEGPGTESGTAIDREEERGVLSRRASTTPLPLPSRYRQDDPQRVFLPSALDRADGAHDDCPAAGLG